MVTTDITTFLNELDNEQYGGTEFVKKVFDFMYKLYNNDVDRSLSHSNESKKLREEVVPLSKYIKQIMAIGKEVNITWMNGSQHGDAIIEYIGEWYKNSYPKNRLIEITQWHDTDYIDNVKALKNSQPRTPKFSTSVNTEHEDKLIELINSRIDAKCSKGYGNDTILLLPSVDWRCLFSDEWEYIIDNIQMKDFTQVAIVDQYDTYIKYNQYIK